MSPLIGPRDEFEALEHHHRRELGAEPLPQLPDDEPLCADCWDAPSCYCPVTTETTGEGTRYTFRSTGQRDLWLRREHPDRECLDAPGCYSTNGGTLSVFLETVTFHPELSK